MSQTGSHVEHIHNPFIKRASYVDLFINELVVSGLRIVSNFTTLSYTTKFVTKLCKRKKNRSNLTLNRQEKKKKRKKEKSRKQSQ